MWLHPYSWTNCCKFLSRTIVRYHSFWYAMSGTWCGSQLLQHWYISTLLFPCSETNSPLPLNSCPFSIRTSQWSDQRFRLLFLLLGTLCTTFYKLFHLWRQSWPPHRYSCPLLAFFDPWCSLSHISSLISECYFPLINSPLYIDSSAATW